MEGILNPSTWGNTAGWLCVVCLLAFQSTGVTLEPADASASAAPVALERSD